MLPKHAVRRRRLGLSVVIAVVTSLSVIAPRAEAVTEQHVHARGTAVFHGSTGDTALDEDVVDIERTPAATATGS